MTASIISTLIGLVLQQAAYVASLSWIAWHYERRTGTDAFHLLLPLILGVSCTWYLAGPAEIPLFAATLAGAIISIGSDSIIVFNCNNTGRIPAHLLLLGSIVVTVTTLTIFEFLTGYQPLGISYGGFFSLSLISAMFLSGLAICSIRRSAPYMDELLLGVQGRQIAQGWRRLRRYPSLMFIISYSVSWFIAVALPVATTGVTSYRLLRDMVIALMIVRLVGSRKPGLILILALAIATLRVTMAYLAVGAWATVLVEASVIAAAIISSRFNDLSRRWSDMRV